MGVTMQKISKPKVKFSRVKFSRCDPNPRKRGGGGVMREEGGVFAGHYGIQIIRYSEPRIHGLCSQCSATELRQPDNHQH